MVLLPLNTLRAATTGLAPAGMGGCRVRISRWFSVATRIELCVVVDDRWDGHRPAVRHEHLRPDPEHPAQPRKPIQQTRPRGCRRVGTVHPRDRAGHRTLPRRSRCLRVRQPPPNNRPAPHCRMRHGQLQSMMPLPNRRRIRRPDPTGRPPTRKRRHRPSAQPAARSCRSRLLGSGNTDDFPQTIG